MNQSDRLPEMDIPILYQDDYFLVIDKPANLLSVPGRGPDKQDCAINRIKVNHPNVRVVHRLDMATSGILILAENHGAQVAMGKLFEQRAVTKTYQAIVDGQLPTEPGIIDLPLICDWENRPIQKVDHKNGKAAQTHYQLTHYDTEKNQSRVTLKPITGRSHQLRVHMLALGNPIIGDYFYAPPTILAQSKRLLLHACEITFTHPFTHKTINILSPVPF